MRRALKIGAWTAGSLVFLVATLLLALLIAGNTDGGRRLIERITAGLTHGHVRLAGLGGRFPLHPTLAQLELADDQGIWLTVRGVSLSWSPLKFVGYHVDVIDGHVALVDMERLPVSGKSSGSPHVPTIDVGHAVIDQVVLGPALAGARASLSAQGDYHLRTLQDSWMSIVAHRTDADGEYDAQLKFTAQRMDAAVTLREPAGGPLEHLLQLPGLGALSAHASLNGPRSAERLVLSIDAGELRARAHGSLDLVNGTTDLDVALASPALAPRPGLAWQRIDLQGRWHGPFKTPTADGKLNAADVVIPGGVRIASLNATLEAHGGKVSTHAVAGGVSIPGPQPDLLQNAPLTADASIRLDETGRPLNITAAHRLFTLRGNAITAGEFNAAVDVRLMDLGPFARFAAQDVSGDATVKAQVTSEKERVLLTANAAIDLTGGSAAWLPLTGNRAGLQLSGSFSSDAIRVERAVLTGRAISLSANGTALRAADTDHPADSPFKSLDLRWQLNLSDLSVVAPTLAGTLSMTGKTAGAMRALTADADIASSLSVRGAPAGNVTASAHVDGLPAAPRGTVRAQGMLDGSPLQLDASLEHLPDNDVHVIVRQADWKSAHAEGDLIAGADAAQAKGDLRARMGQLADLQRLLGVKLQGRVAANLAVRPHDGHADAEVQIDATDVGTGDSTVNLKLRGSGPVETLALEAHAEMPNLGGEAATATTQAMLNLSAHELQVAKAELSYHGQTLQLLEPAQLSFADGIRLSRWRFGLQKASLEIEGRLSSPIDLRAALHQVDPTVVNAFYPGLLSKGVVEAGAEVHGSFSAPTGEVHLEALGLRSANGAARGLPAVEIHANAELRGNDANLTGKLAAGKASQLTLGGRAPLNDAGRFDLKLAGVLDVGLANPVLEAHGQRAAGELTVDTGVTGTLAAPEIGGSVRLEKGNLRDYAQGVNLTDIAGTLVGEHGTLRIENLTAKAAPGNVTVTGTVGIMQKGIPVDVTLAAKNAQPIASNLVTASLNADIHVGGTARDKLDVTGTVRINKANIEIPSSLPPNVAVLDVRRPGREPPPRPVKPLVIDLDVTVQAPRQILVQGRGLDAELGGEVHVRGTTETPRVSGGFDLQRGTFSLASSQLTFSSGTVGFNGTGLRDKIDPTLDFAAQSTVGEYTVTLKITGFADAPKIALSSTPELPQDEILARLLFGESASQLSALQVAQIGAALATLSGGGGGLNPLAKIQKTLGLDRLSVGGGTSTGTANNNTNTGASIEAGRYVSSRVFVGVKQSTTGNSQLAVDVDLSKHLKLQARLGDGTTTAQGTTPENDPGSSLGIAYQFEYD